MESQTVKPPTEDQIIEYLLNKSKFSERVLVKDWSGWSYKEGGRSIQTNFYRAFDIAMIERQGMIKTGYDLIITGYEAKGYTLNKQKKWSPPAFGEGLDQALALLMNGADFAYLVHPEPKRSEDKLELKELCERYANYLGLIIVSNDLTYYNEIKKPEKNPYSYRDRKRDMLTALAIGGHYDKKFGLALPSWVKTRQY
jgi:hypothetical protein